MLVLTRKTQERIHIGDNITISILKLKGNTVRIGIEAPRDIRVLRGELPTFDGTFEVEASAAETSQTTTSQAEPANRESKESEEEATVSELEWEVLKKLASRRKPCRPARRCSPKANVGAPLALMLRSTSLAASPAALRK
ncbi:MAG: carbon storage regulator [Planctomycetota bacterium]|nr:carbon storage regulator [Planctomycetota bacterium]